MRGLVAGMAALLLVAGCAPQPQPPPEPQAQPAAPEVEKEDTQTEGMTLKDVADELEWRKKTTQELKTGT